MLLLLFTYFKGATGWRRGGAKFFHPRNTLTFNALVDHQALRMIVNDMVESPKNPLDLAFAALADQTRRAILSQLLEQDQTVKQVAASYEMSLAAISKHLQILVRAGLIRQVKHGREKICQLEPNALRAASLWMESFGFFPADFLEEVEGELETLGLSQTS